MSRWSLRKRRPRAEIEAEIVHINEYHARRTTAINQQGLVIQHGEIHSRINSLLDEWEQAQ